MASIVKELDHGNLRCDPRVLYLEVDLDETSSPNDLAETARDIIARRVNQIGVVDDLQPMLW